MNAFQQIDALRREADKLKHALDSMGFNLLPAENGLYRAKARRVMGVGRPDISGPTTAEILARANELLAKFPPRQSKNRSSR